MKYDRQKQWNITTNRRDEKSFKDGYKAALYPHNMYSFTYINKPKTPYEKGINAGIKGLKEQKMIDMLEGNNKPERINYRGSGKQQMPFADFMDQFIIDTKI